jgi:uncharacterized protein (TIGR02246 family)
MGDAAGRAVGALYAAVLNAWNRRDAAAYADCFADAGALVGFDGSEMHGRDEIAATLGRIFADHVTATYVSIVREVRPLGGDAVLLRAVAGMVPRGGRDLNPAVNAVQSLVAARRDGRWRIELFHNTPAALHGRPEAAEALTAELRAALQTPDRAVALGLPEDL